MKKRLGGIALVALAGALAIAAFASNAQSADNTVDWQGSDDAGKVVWRHMKNGGKRYKYELPAGKYARAVETDTIGMMCSPPGDGQYLANSHNRCDGWFRVAPGQAGTWTLAVGYDVPDDLDNGVIANANDWLREVCLNTGIYFADTASALTSGGVLDPQYAAANNRSLNTAGAQAVLGYLRTHAIPTV